VLIDHDLRSARDAWSPLHLESEVFHAASRARAAIMVLVNFTRHVPTPCKRRDHGVRSSRSGPAIDSDETGSLER